MQGVTFDTQDVAMLGDDLFCRTPEALETAFAKLRSIGYEIKDMRTDEDFLGRNSTTPAEMEQQGAYLWYACLPDIRMGKCGDCQQLISTRAIKSHGHTCEKCGAVTYLELPDGETVRFRFRDKKARSIYPQLEMRIVHWDFIDGWLYLDPEPLESEGFPVAHEDEAQECLNKHADKWERTEYEGQPALKMRYVRMGGAEDRSDNAIEMYHVFYSYQNYKIVRVWDGVEYPEYGPDFPIPESIHVYELWHRAVAHEQS